MKKIMIIGLFICSLLNANKSKAVLIISTKARYGGNDSCTVAKGLCIILKGQKDDAQKAIGQIIGDISNDPSKGLTLIIDRYNGITNEDYEAYFKNGYFFIDGEITFQPNILSSIQYNGATIFPIKKYSYTIENNKINIHLK